MLLAALQGADVHSAATYMGNRIEVRWPSAQPPCRPPVTASSCAGGKDSTVLAHIMTTLNRRHDYGLNLFLLSIDEGITG